ncbi:MAG TPA: ABC transporter ATP-binding protein [Acidimicrobiia bacterium]|mgnify:CR=1 FL=1|nr:ABC transporter ATP-binding protein [Acidimicrobiia bacterium]
MTTELELRGITKRFPGVLACDGIDLTARRGEIHCLVGENGAGKTTLMSILYGLFPPDEGEMLVRGRPVRFNSPLDAIRLGLGMVHQAFKLFPSLTVAENVIFREEPAKLGWIDRKGAVARVRELADAYGLAVDPTAKVEDLPVGVLQRVEILKALYRDASILILDEPTAVLTPQERDRLFDVMRRLRDSGRTILFITHKLAEVMAVADRITVLRNGRAVAELDPAATTPEEISRHMTGRDVEPVRAGPSPSLGDVVLSVDALTVAGVHGLPSVSEVSFDVRSGEIVGIAAVAGNGQTELVEAIAGLREATAGTVTLRGVDITHLDVAARRRAGMCYVPEDRHRVGTAAAASVSENLLMGYQRTDTMKRGAWLRRGAVHTHAHRLREDYAIRVSGIDVAAGTLSGGNLQKVALAREMTHEAPLIIAEQPTRGVDIGAIEFIHTRLVAARDRGAAILLVSAELSEIQSLATRILVMFEGRIVAELDPDVADEAEIGLHMTGGRVAGA